MARTKESRPNIAVVYADGEGRIDCFDGRRLKRSELAAAHYRIQYEVDLGDHRRTTPLGSSSLPAQGDTYFFQSMVDVGFRVTDPAAVVRRNVTDGLAVVHGYLVNAFRRITRSFDIREAAEAEEAINIRYRQSVTLEEGITIYHCRAQLAPDEAASNYLRSLNGAGPPSVSPKTGAVPPSPAGSRTRAAPPSVSPRTGAVPPGPAGSRTRAAPPSSRTGTVPPGQVSPGTRAQAPAVVPVYLIIDESATSGAYFQALDDGLRGLLAGLAGQPEVLAAVRLAVLGYAHDVAARMPVNAITADTMQPQFVPRPGASLTSVFAYLHSHIPQDMDWLKSRHRVVRPTVYLLSATAPDPEPGWEIQLARILDRTAFPYAPNIVACGVDAMPAEALQAIADRPRCLAFAADPGLPVREAIRHYTAFVQREIAAQVHAQISGRNEVIITAPARFHALREL
jgi:uncharacterized protein YegL